MIRSSILLAAIAAALAPMAQAQIPLTIGNLAVLRVGDGLGGLTAAAAPMFIDEYTTAGVLVQSIPLPTVSTPGGNRSVVVRGSATSEGFLGMSSNGIYLTFCGYEAAVGAPSASTSGESAINVPRVIGRMDIAAGIDTTTAITDGYNAGNIRAAATDDGTRFWATGSNDGTRFVANVGDTTSTLINGGSPTNMRVIDIFDGDLFATTASSGAGTIGPVQIGQGLPTVGGQSQVLLNGFPTTAGTGSPYDFYFASPTILYVADDLGTTSTVSGIQKWELVGGVWTFQYRLSVSTSATTVKVSRGITGFTQDGITTLYATADDGFGTSGSNSLMVVTDLGASSVPVEIATSPADTRFRGVRLIGLPSTINRLFGTGCSGAELGLFGNGQIGTDVRAKMTGAVGFPFLMFGVAPLGLPLTACSCVAVTTPDALVAGPTLTLPIPNVPSLIGATILAQGLDVFDPAATCLEVPFATLTDGYQFTIQ